jgi:hypothetical protein
MPLAKKQKFKGGVKCDPKRFAKGQGANLNQLSRLSLSYVLKRIQSVSLSSLTVSYLVEISGK